MKFLLAVHVGQLIGALIFGMVLTALCMDIGESTHATLTPVSIVHMSLHELAQVEI